MKAIAEESTVVEMLNQLTKRHSNLFWTMRCTFCDGLTEPVHELILYHRQGEKYTKKIVSFLGGSGKLQRASCQGVADYAPDNIIDYLLDWMNKEKIQLV